MPGSSTPWMLQASAGAFQAVARLSNRPSARVLMRHKFLFDEPKPQSIGRLRRELEWIRKEYAPASMDRIVDGLTGGDMPENAITYTIDDATDDIMAVAGEFRDFGVPVTMYVPIGWIRSDQLSEAGAICELVTLIQWYEGEDIDLAFGDGETLRLSPALKAGNIDRIIENREQLEPHFEELCARIAALPGSHRQRHQEKDTCNWAELAELAAGGVSIQSHSISHVKMSLASPVRAKFEVSESKRVIEARLGPCTTFAYPFGTADSYSKTSEAALRAENYAAAFLVHGDVVVTGSTAFELPRICIADAPVPIEEFKARVRGAGILRQRLKRALGR